MDEIEPLGPTPTTDLFHVGLTVRSLDASLHFYRDLVGMTVIERLHRRSKNFDALMSNGSATEVKVAYLTLGSFCLQLIEYVVGGDERLVLSHRRPGNPHLCFYVDDVRETYAGMRDRADVTITSEVVQVAPTMLSFYTADPDGVPVEFLERTAPVEGWTGSVDVED